MASADTLIFIDTCSLLVSCWNISPDNTIKYNSEKDTRFWQGEMPMLSLMGSIILAKRNYDELVKLASVLDDPMRPKLGERCKIILDRVRPLIASGIVSIVGDPNGPFADAILLSAALKFRTQKNLLFLTQDRALATDLIAISHFQSVHPRKGYELKVCRLNSGGSIERWRLDSKSGKQLKKTIPNSNTGMNLPHTNDAETRCSVYAPTPEWWR